MKLYVIVIISIVLHFGSNHMYTYICSPLSVKGLLLTPFKTQSPECKMIRWIQNVTTTNLNCFATMIIQFGYDFATNISKHLTLSRIQTV